MNLVVITLAWAQGFQVYHIGLEDECFALAKTLTAFKYADKENGNPKLYEFAALLIKARISTEPWFDEVTQDPRTVAALDKWTVFDPKEYQRLHRIHLTFINFD